MIETLFKAKQYQLVEYILTDDYGYNYKKLKDNWNTVKICLRNKYIINNPNDYFDHLKLLNEFGKDTLNAHYVCPKDFKAEHQIYIKKEQKRIREKKFKELIDKINQDNIKYVKNKKRFFNLELSTGELKIMPIKSVKQLYEESSKLSHCAFINSYHTKENSLLLSAQYNGKLVETIEYDIKTYSVIQARGLENKASKYHTQILNLIEQNNSKNNKQLCQSKNTKKTIKGFRLVSEPTDIPVRKVDSSKLAADYARQFYLGDIDVYESFFMILLNRANNTTSFAKISQGGTIGTVVDIKIICKIA